MAADIVLIKGNCVSSNSFADLVEFAEKHLPLSAKGIEAPVTSDLSSSLVAIVITEDGGVVTGVDAAAIGVTSLSLSAVRKAYGITDKTSKETSHAYQREMSKAIGGVLGLTKGCLNPHCAMSEYEKRGIKKLGKNYCPACLWILERKYRSRMEGEKDKKSASSLTAPAASSPSAP